MSVLLYPGSQVESIICLSFSPAWCPGIWVSGFKLKANFKCSFNLEWHFYSPSGVLLHGTNSPTELCHFLKQGKITKRFGIFGIFVHSSDCIDLSDCLFSMLSDIL